MRLFPVTVRQRLLATTAVVALGAGVLSSPLAHADIKHLRHQQSQARHSVRHAQANLDESSRQANRAYAALNRSRDALHAARHDLQVARDHVQQARSRLEQVRHQLHEAWVRLDKAKTNQARGQKAVGEQRDKLIHTVTSFYEEGDPQLIGFLSLLKSASPADLTAKQANNNLVLDSQNQILGSLKASEVMLQVQTDELAKARDHVARKKEQAHSNFVLERTYKQEAASARDRVMKKVEERRHAVAMARRARAHDRRVLARSRARENRVHRLLMAQIAREQRRGGGFHGATSGLLMPPVNGPITSPYGYRINPVMGYYGLHDGDDFAAACGTPIWAAGNGTVMSQYYSSVWGNRLYLNLGLINGKNVTVIYNHLSAYRSYVGEHVSRGQVVGLIGTTGWSTGCHTHMTVMVNGTAVNPAPWLGLG
ncbi:MAG: peptidoglycan DD-metalloendopeptidase family protein [Nocardioides sp.]|nr:peptidoglycan DD-metalloendopeptidase family protein [Nocardioides sp.]